MKHNVGPQKAANSAQGHKMNPSGLPKVPRDAESVPRAPPERHFCELNGPKVVPKTDPERHERNMLDLNSDVREVFCVILVFFEAK